MTSGDLTTPPGLERKAPPPIPFPSRDESEHQRRIRQQISEAHEARVIALETQAQQRVAAAHAHGLMTGEKTGYTMGWHWGLICGVVLGMLMCLGMINIGQWWASA